MTFSPDIGAQPDVAGSVAGWKLTFLTEDQASSDAAESDFTASRSEYVAEIKVSSAANFRPANFEIKIDGFDDQSFSRLALESVGESAGADAYRYVRIDLGWSDVGGGLAELGAAISSLGGDAADPEYTTTLLGRIRQIERVAGQFHYQTIIRGMDRVGFRLKRVCLSAADIDALRDLGENITVNKYAKKLAEVADVPFTGHPTDEGGLVIPGRVDFREGQTVEGALRELQPRTDEEDQEIPILIRLDGLHVGVVTANGTTPHHLELSSGLAGVVPVAEDDDDATCGSEDDPAAVHSASRLSYDVTLLGKPEIQVADFVEIPVESPDVFKTDAPLGLKGMVGAIGDAFGGFEQLDPDVDFSAFRVASASHHITRARGFLTMLRVEPLPAEDAESESTAAEARREADLAAGVAAALARAAGTETRTLNVGLVNAQHVDASAPIASQRVDLYEGLDPSPAVDQAIDSALSSRPRPLHDKPYLTPFAFGPTGLVIPHYPGMRVLTHHYRGMGSEAIVGGCLWPGGIEPDGKIGDWWLSLPTGVDPDTSTDDPAGASFPNGPASHDLIDAAGGRAIHVGGLRVTIGEALMPAAGTRPGDPPAGQLDISFQKGEGGGATKAAIKIDADGNIEISTDGTLTLSANKIEVKTKTTVEVTKES